MEFLITADASKVSGREFFHALFGRPAGEEALRQARRAHEEAVQETFKLPTLWEQIEARQALGPRP